MLLINRFLLPFHKNVRGMSIVDAQKRTQACESTFSSTARELSCVQKQDTDSSHVAYLVMEALATAVEKIR